MRRGTAGIWFCWLGLILGMRLAPGAGAAEPRAVETSMVEFRGGHGPIKGFLARPKGEGPFPAIVVVHEWWGLSEWIKENAKRLAEQGYVALAPDLYQGKVTMDPGEAHELMRALDDSEAVGDLKGAVAHLKTLPSVAKDQKMGTIGWCMGGKLARLLSQSSESIGPTVICYGSVATEADQIAKLQGKPVLGIFGATDRGIPVSKVQEFGKLLQAKSNGNPVTIRIFEGAGHGFMRPRGPQFKADEAAEAWKEINSFFAANLKP